MHVLFVCVCVCGCVHIRNGNNKKEKYSGSLTIPLKIILGVERNKYLIFIFINVISSPDDEITSIINTVLKIIAQICLHRLLTTLLVAYCKCHPMQMDSILKNNTNKMW